MSSSTETAALLAALLYLVAFVVALLPPALSNGDGGRGEEEAAAEKEAALRVRVGVHCTSSLLCTSRACDAQKETPLKLRQSLILFKQNSIIVSSK